MNLGLMHSLLWGFLSQYNIVFLQSVVFFCGNLKAEWMWVIFRPRDMLREQNMQPSEDEFKPRVNIITELV